MTDLTFAQPARRNIAAPVLSALVILAVALALFIHLNPHLIPSTSITKIAYYSTHIVFEQEATAAGRVIGGETGEDNLYVLTTVHIQNPLRFSISPKDFTATLTVPNAEPITTSAVEKPDFPNLYLSFPELKSRVDQQGSPLLLRDTQIEPGQSADGLLLLHFPVTQAAWDQRTAANLTVDFYQQSVTIPIPKP